MTIDSFGYVFTKINRTISPNDKSVFEINIINKLDILCSGPFFILCALFFY